MAGAPEPSPANFGGRWTIEKLDILRRYLDFYTTALKNRPYRLMYIDAFAGTGNVSLRTADDDARAFIDGSAKLAIDIEERSFDRLIFVEEDSNRYAQLCELWRKNPDRDIQLHKSDANRFLRNLREDWKEWRGVLFLDPFATEVEWATIEKTAGFKALDTWILFPISAISRILPKSRNPDDISPSWAGRLTNIFGDESWKSLYYVSPQQSFFEEELYQRDPGTAGISHLYKDKLRNLFGHRFMETTKTFANSKNSPLFEFIFCVGNPGERAVNLAKRVAGYLLNASG